MKRFGDIIISPTPSEFIFTIYERALTLANKTGSEFILIGGQTDIFEYGLIDKPKMLAESGFQLICPELGDCGNSGKRSRSAIFFSSLISARDRAQRTLIHSSIYSLLLSELHQEQSQLKSNDKVKQSLKLLQLNSNIRSHVGEKLIEHFKKPKHIAAAFFGGIKSSTLLPSQYRRNETVKLFEYPKKINKDDEVLAIVVSETQKIISREVTRCSKNIHQLELADGFQDVASLVLILK